MLIYGVALLSGCYLIGDLIGELLGELLGIHSNVGGVGFGMLLLLVFSTWATHKGFLHQKESQGITFWSGMYIPIVVAMTAIQNVTAALSGGIISFLGGILAVALGFLMIPLFSPKTNSTPPEDEYRKEA